MSRIVRLSPDTFEIDLTVVDDRLPEYRAGHYLQLSMDLGNNPGTQLFSYSIANRFDEAHPKRLQLFIQQQGDLSVRILDHLSVLKQQNTSLTVFLPKGRSYLQTALNQPHLLVAAGSGIAKIKCLTEEILYKNPDAAIDIYWSNRRVEQFYLSDQFRLWSEKYSSVSFTPVLESEAAEWRGRSGFLYQVIQKDFQTLSNVPAYLCGSPKMVYGTIDQLKELGLSEMNCYSDVFEYAPRDGRIAI